jgi:hypothetical protein
MVRLQRRRGLPGAPLKLTYVDVSRSQVVPKAGDGGVVPGQRLLGIAGPLQPAQALGWLAYEMEQPTQAVLGGGQVGTEGGDGGLGLGQRGQPGLCS